MDWLCRFARTKPKPDDYAEKTLAAYRRGAKAGGSIRGVRILVGADSCPACRNCAERVYAVDEAPRLPVAECTQPEGCRCAYTLAMKDHPVEGEMCL